MERWRLFMANKPEKANKQRLGYDENNLYEHCSIKKIYKVEQYSNTVDI